MIDILNIVKQHLQSSEILLPIKLGFLADEPDEAVALYYLEGDDPNVYFEKSTSGISRPRFRIRVRALQYSKAWEQAVAIREALNGFKQGDELGVFADGDIVPLGQDELKRTEFELNYRTLVNQ
jgi:hypothetical protein